MSKYMRKKHKFAKNDLVRGDHRCPVGERIGSVVQVQDIDMGAGRVLIKVQVLWIKGPQLGTTTIFDERDLELMRRPVLPGKGDK